MKAVLLFSFIISFSLFSFATELKVGDAAPLFKSKTQAGANFDLSAQKGKWTVLYFYPKAGTPGCTTQACAFRDSIDKVKAAGAEVYGVSADSIAELAKFHKEHHLKFDLLSDNDGKVIEAYGTKLPVVKYSKRWTFIVGPDLKIKSVMKDVDPALDAANVIKEIEKLKAKSI